MTAAGNSGPAGTELTEMTDTTKSHGGKVAVTVSQSQTAATKPCSYSSRRIVITATGKKEEEEEKTKTQLSSFPFCELAT